MRRQGINICVVCVTAGACLTAGGRAQSPANERVEVENQSVRAIRETIEPHGKAVLHTVPESGAVVVYLTDEGRHKAGDAVWMPAGTYKSENPSDQPLEAVYIEPKPASTHLEPLAPEKRDPTAIDSKYFHLEFENDLVRIIRAKVGADDKPGMHRHPATNAVLVYLTDQDMRQVHEDGTSGETHNKAQQVKWSPKTGAHRDEVMGGKGFELIRVELKQSR